MTLIHLQQSTICFKSPTNNLLSTVLHNSLDDDGDDNTIVSHKKREVFTAIQTKNSYLKSNHFIKTKNIACILLLTSIKTSFGLYNQVFYISQDHTFINQIEKNMTNGLYALLYLIVASSTRIPHSLAYSTCTIIITCR